MAELSEEAVENFENSTDPDKWREGIKDSESFVFGSKWTAGLERKGVKNVDEIDGYEVWAEKWGDGWNEYKRSEKANVDAKIWATKTRVSSYRWKRNWEREFGDADNWDV